MAKPALLGQGDQDQKGSSLPVMICLLGTSRCGSTLLQEVLSLYEGVAALGEVRRLSNLAREGRLCSCGATLSQCDIWRPSVPVASPYLTTKRFVKHANTAAAATALMLRVPGLAPRSEWRIAVTLREIIGLAQSGLRAPFLVDSSKDPHHLVHLLLEGSLSIVPVHLIRDPRAVVWSGLRRLGADPRATARHWVRVNAALLALRHLTRHLPWHVVRYEDFCYAPEATVKQILSSAGHSGSVDRSTKISHALGGSPDFHFKGLDTIYIDEEWRRKLSPDLQDMVLRKGSILARQFQYR